MSKDEKANIDTILQQVHGAAGAQQRDAIDDDVNAILESLGMPAKPKPGVLSPQRQETSRQSGDAGFSQPAQPASVGQEPRPLQQRSFQPQAAQAAQTQAAGEPRVRPKPVAAARIVDTAPLSAPVVQKDTETLELPNLKTYKDMQAHRVAEIERVAAERALERAAERQRQTRYDVPGTKQRPEVLSVEVDDRFRAFFGKTVVDDGSGAAMEETGEITLQRARRKPKGGKVGRRKGLFEKPAQPEYENETDNTGDAYEPAQELPGAAPYGGAADGLPPLLDMTGNIDVLSVREQMAQSKAQNQAQHPAPMQWPEPPPKQEVRGKQAAQAKSVARASDFTESITPPVAPSDTFMMNHLDDRAQEIYTEPAAQPQEGVTQFAGVTPDGVYEEAPFDENAYYDDPNFNGAAYEQASYSDGSYDYETDRPKGTTYRELTITMPLGRTTSTIGIDPDKYGVPNADYEEATDYNHLSDAPDVAQSLRGMCIARMLRICITALLSGILIYMGIAATNATIPFVAALSAQTQPMAFLIVNLVLLAVTGIVCMSTIGAGLAGLFGRPSADSMTALACVGAMAQLVAYIISAKSYTPETVTLFAPLAAVLLCANSVGKWLHSKSVSNSFEIASAGEDHAAAFIVPNRELTKMACMGLNEPDPLLLVSRPTALVRGFMRQSFSSHISDVYGRKLSLIMFMCATVCGVIAGLKGDSVLAGISSAAAALCMAAPLSATLVYAVPAFLLQRAAGLAGAVVPGPSAVKKLGLCNTVLLHSQHLFPATSVRLHGIKPFGKQRIDLAILYAASIVYENCDTLRDTFMRLIDGKTGMLHKVESPQTEVGFGYSGWIEGHEVLFGNRALMRRHNIELPSGDYERKFSKGGTRCVMYLAVGGRAFSMYVVSYQPDAEAQEVLDSLAESGISVLVQSDDFNINEALVATTYHVSPALVKVLSQPESEMLAGQTDYMPESEGYMTHRGTCGSFVGGLRAAATAARREYLADTVQMASVLFTMLIAIVLSVFMALPELALTVVLLYQLAWGVITVLPAIFKQ